MNPKSENERNLLFRAIDHSWRLLRPYRNLNTALAEDYAGGSYLQNRASGETYFNLAHMTADAYMTELVPARPRVLITTRDVAAKSFQNQFQYGLNRLLEDINFEQTLRRMVLDAFLMIGISKVHVGDAGQIEIERDVWMDPGKPFCSNVSLDNFCFDMNANKWSEKAFSVDFYRVPHRDLEWEGFDQKVAKNVHPSSKFNIDQERREWISRGFQTDVDEYEPMVDLCDLYVAEDQRIDTYAVSRSVEQVREVGGGPLASMDWDGRETGPHQLLQFSEVPDNIMGVSPAMQLRPLYNTVNNILRKQCKRSYNARRIHTYTPAAAHAAVEMKMADDDKWVAVNNVDEVGEKIIGGVDPQSVGWLGNVMDMFDQHAGGLRTMQGLAPSADTARQEQIIQRANSKKTSSMSEQVMATAVDSIKELAGLLWDDEFTEYSGQEPLPGAQEYSIDMKWPSQERIGKFEDYDITIDLYSMVFQGPQDRMNAITSLVQNIYMQNAQAFMAQGGSINFQKLNDMYADMLNLPRLKEIVQFTSPLPGQQPGPGGGDATSGKGNHTRRDYVRHNQPAQQSYSDAYQMPSSEAEATSQSLA